MIIVSAESITSEVVATTGGILYFQEYTEFTGPQAVLFATGILTGIVGVVLLTSARLATADGFSIDIGFTSTGSAAALSSPYMGLPPPERRQEDGDGGGEEEEGSETSHLRDRPSFSYEDVSSPPPPPPPHRSGTSPQNSFQGKEIGGDTLSGVSPLHDSTNSAFTTYYGASGTPR